MIRKLNINKFSDVPARIGFFYETTVIGKIKFYFTRAKLSQYMYTITPWGDLEISSLKGYSYLLSTSQRSNFQRF